MKYRIRSDFIAPIQIELKYIRKHLVRWKAANHIFWTPANSILGVGMHVCSRIKNNRTWNGRTTENHQQNNNTNDNNKLGKETNEFDRIKMRRKESVSDAVVFSMSSVPRVE